MMSHWEEGRGAEGGWGQHGVEGGTIIDVLILNTEGGKKVGWAGSGGEAGWGGGHYKR